MSFNGNEGSKIELSEGAALTKAYRDANAGTSDLILAHFIGKEKLKLILDQAGCMGIRIYYGINADGKKSVVLVGADANENDMLDQILDKTWPCPDACSQTNSLNSNA